MSFCLSSFHLSGVNFLALRKELEGTFPEQSAFDLAVAELLVALDDDFMHLHLLFLVHLKVENHVVLVGQVVTLANGYLGILVAFVVEVFLGENLGAVNDVGCNLPSYDDTEFGLHVFTF